MCLCVCVRVSARVRPARACLLVSVWGRSAMILLACLCNGSLNRWALARCLHGLLKLHIMHVCAHPPMCVCLCRMAQRL